MSPSKSHSKWTAVELAEVETLTLTRKILRSAKGALTAKQLAEVLNISPKTVFKLAKAGFALPLALLSLSFLIT